MAFIFEIGCDTHQKTIANTLVSIFRMHGVEASIEHENGLITCAINQDHPRLQEAFDAMGSLLPASVFMRGSSHRFDETPVTRLPEFLERLPLGLGVCPRCTGEMLDPSSRRYYYPFTSCNHCGGQYAFFDAYPYVRENTALRAIPPCPACAHEFSADPFREGYPQIGCPECGVGVSMREGDELFLARSSAEYKTLFERAAALIAAGKKIRIKTTTGIRVFAPSDAGGGTALMVFNASKLSTLFSLIDEEFNALLSIERPVLHVALKDERLKSVMGDTADAQYCDDGFTLLLGRELIERGIDAAAVSTDEYTPVDAVIDYDIAINTQSPMRLFLNKDVRFVAQGERGSFPAFVVPALDVASFAHSLAAVRVGEKMLIDRPEHLGGTATSKVNALEGEQLGFSHGNIHRFDQDTASFMAVLAENGLRKNSAVCAYFDETITFLYTKGEHITRIIPAEPFVSAGLIGRIGSLREGSDRLIGNLRSQHVQLYGVLETIESSSCSLFEAAAMIVGLENPAMSALAKEALRFVGKGGLQIDTKLRDNRFDSVAFLASIISYRLADVPTPLLCYSIFESLGDYFSDILTELKNRSKAEHVVLCGSGFANQSLYSRVVRNLKNTPPVLSRSFPIGRENGVVGGIYL